MQYKNTLEFAKELDQKDELAFYRNQFYIPKDKAGNNWLYFTGNSLGLQPKKAKEYINIELKDWAEKGVEGHFDGQNPWVTYPESLSPMMAKVVGAKPSEVIIMDTLTANLHFLMVSFYRPTKKRYKILIESDAFPSDRYAVQSQLKFHGYSEEDLIYWSPPKGKDLLEMDDLEKILAAQGNQIALVLIGGVNYYTGQRFDFKKIAELGHAKGCVVGIDLAHGVGNIKANLHDSGVDFAAWCTYKYLNSGPGSLSGIFVHEKHSYNTSLPRFAGWWNHNKDTRFNMRLPFDVMSGAEGWQLSNPPILAMAPIKASLEMFEEVGMEALREKSIKLTGFMEYLFQELGSEAVSIITPKNPEERGCQLSIQVKKATKSLHQKLMDKHVITDWREPNVIRCAPTPMYNTYQDVYNMVLILKDILKDY